MKLFLILLINFSISSICHAQDKISGAVYGENGNDLKPLAGANIKWQHTTVGTLSNEKGLFDIERHPSQDSLVVSFIGYESQTLFIPSNLTEIQVVLKPDDKLDDLVIDANYQSLQIDKQSVGMQQKITGQELKKAACCDLSESFETNPSVDVSFSDAVSGAKKIKMLGLDGIYSLITVENIPSIRGLSSSFGLNSIPGSWIESIQLAKGIGSVVNGYESTTGQINIELLKPSEAPKYHLKIYGNHLGRFEATAAHNIKLNDKWSTGLMVHGSNLSNKVDGNGDGFMDLPQHQQINMTSRWEFYNGTIRSIFGARFMSESRTSGDVNFRRAQNISPLLPYGVMIDQQRLDVFGKLGILPTEKHDNRSLGLIANYTYYNQESQYGLKYYNGSQHFAYFNGIFADELWNHYNLIKAGINLTYDDYHEIFQDDLNSQDTLMRRTEMIAGIFGEYTYHPNKRFSLIAGGRVDFHNLFGVIPTPRLHVRYKISRNVTWRFAAGTGMRYPNVLVDNMRSMVSSRRLVFDENLQPERAVNTGMSLVWDFDLFDKTGMLSADVFRTQFLNQVIMDMDQDPYALHFYNLDGQSFANVVQADFFYDLTRQFAIRLSHKWQDVRATINGTLQRQPYVARNKSFMNLEYTTRENKWAFDATLLFTDQARLPNSAAKPAEYQWANESEAFWRLNAQVTRKFGAFELFVGGENLTNFKQQNPIVAVDNPFGNEFDAGNVWGPIVGRIVYFGFRFSYL